MSAVLRFGVREERLEQLQDRVALPGRVQDSRDASSALKTFLKAYQLAPASIEVNRSLGWAYAKNNRSADAIAAFRYVIAAAPGQVADQEFRELITQAKEYRDLQRDLAWGYAKWQAWGAARQEFERMLKNLPDDQDLLFGLGTTLYMEGKLQEAEQTLKKAISSRKLAAPQTRWVSFGQSGSFPILTTPRTMLGWVAVTKKNYKEATKLFAETLKREPEIVDALVGVAFSLQQEKKSKEAREFYLRAVEIYPQYPAVLAGLRETQSAMVGSPKGGGEYNASPAQR
jgi:Tfp pilus assembly protein PilF